MVKELWEATAEAARDIESMENYDELREQVIDVEVTSQLDGTLKEISVYYNTRNIKVKVDLWNGTVTGYSHGRHAVPIMDSDAEERILKPLADFYEMQWECK